MRLFARAASGALCACAALPGTAAADTAGTGDASPPLWEAGIAGAAGTQADYPASDRYRPRFIPFPYFVYRGRLFRSDENGARLHAEMRSDVELDISAGASFAAHSDQSGPRAGMPNIGYLFQVGPNLRYIFARPRPGLRWQVELPVRSVQSIDSWHMTYRGLVFEPDIGLRDRSVLGSGWNGYASLGPEFASARLEQYFYQVDPQYARPDRPVYYAHGGYAGSRLELGGSHKLGRQFRVFFYTRLDEHARARNEGSPLFKANEELSAFAGVSWAFWHSRGAATAPEDLP
ncbi:MAG: MipA/OmpV family protein [Nevskia sp.]|nr:MipA/OmpV family protein [Nevskia sp.]